MAQGQAATLTAADFREVLQKLEVFNQGLPPGEQAALEELLQEAMVAAVGDAEVSGYSLTAIPFPEGDIMQAFGVA